MTILAVYAIDLSFVFEWCEKSVKYASLLPIATIAVLYFRAPRIRGKGNRKNIDPTYVKQFEGTYFSVRTLENWLICKIKPYDIWIVGVKFLHEVFSYMKDSKQWISIVLKLLKLNNLTLVSMHLCEIDFCRFCNCM